MERCRLRALFRSRTMSPVAWTADWGEALVAQAFAESPVPVVQVPPGHAHTAFNPWTRIITVSPDPLAPPWESTWAVLHETAHSRQPLGLLRAVSSAGLAAYGLFPLLLLVASRGAALIFVLTWSAGVVGMTTVIERGADDATARAWAASSGNAASTSTWASTLTRHRVTVYAWGAFLWNAWLPASIAWVVPLVLGFPALPLTLRRRRSLSPARPVGLWPQGGRLWFERGQSGSARLPPEGGGRSAGRALPPLARGEACGGHLVLRRWRRGCRILSSSSLCSRPVVLAEGPDCTFPTGPGRPW